jgi:predicted PurR-regulated permease PerM
MRQLSLQKPFFIFLLLGVSALMVGIYLPFVSTLVISVALAVVMQPAYKNLTRLLRGHQTLAAFCTVVLTMLLVLAPLVFLTLQIVKESAELYQEVTRSGTPSIQAIVGLAEKPIRRYIPDFSFDVRATAEFVLGWISQHLTFVFSSTIQLLVNGFIGTLALFYLLKDGSRLKRELIAISPLADEYDSAIASRMTDAINSVLKGQLLIALIQGVLSGIGFAIFGVPNPALWGSLAAICALIPGFGTSLVLVPAIIYLYFIDGFANTIGLTVWSVAIVGLIDNFLSPYLVGRGVRIHSFLVLLAVLGGISYFGTMGFILGPLILSLFFALLDIYRLIFREGKK